MCKYFSLTLIFLIIVSINTHADVLIIDRINTNQLIETPQKGLSMNQVKQKFGEPLSKKDAVGQPPIVIWKYGKFSVYFESNWVINSVVHKTNSHEKGPKPIKN